MLDDSQKDIPLKAQETPPKSKMRLLIIIAIILLIVLGWTLLSRSTWFNPREGYNGISVNPPVSLRNFKVIGDDGSELDFALFEGKWVLLYITPTTCAEDCLDTLYKIREARQMLGRDSYKVHRLLVTLPKEKKNPLYQLLKNEYSTTQYGIINQNQLEKLLDKLPAGMQSTNYGVLYLVDPKGYIVLSYPPSITAKGIAQDLQKEMA